ncbi:MAG: hypothetical protein UT12_C0010G0007 [Candidatus Curtissbacteria bacterium GW2011_GWC2_38_9]|uniref:TIR domain-containing protein n=3 Tax=Candidatus Curtissiibacteriota TaxID=1752717 RepID=A0A1F5HS04_9BACT|nr:MAG: hypothetical protein UT12_C0010G0007 [Candidatus Curtissbacteria bacterium GW2011_GWC2_38_9]KKS04623.1 MAG: hypothetical protein UU56_C0004G0024 [Candidatus Curtissbacteria bacterium GW2011_GWA2_41_24]OGD88501.1 MAG: hypothetical protein A2Z54_02460 [Candidatus Curtissbacteria bacterium RIFCSPHIGHO2_02_39_8]OGE06749.1 MAG: hypothetical protein A2W70_04845 [Candidatus Curtissbacteria bacterium RIFCSPLOWO2_02_41_11]
MDTKVFISYSFADKNKFRFFDKQLRRFLETTFGIDAYSFVFDFKKKTDNKTLMKLALEKIDESDLLLAELTYKSIGIGIEVGYAKAKGKRIIYMHRIGTELSTTTSGVCDIRIEYKDISDLLVQLKKVLKKQYVR